MAKFTNWIRQGFFIFSVEKPPRLIASIGTANFSLREAEANARLIAAAPKMYEALKQIRDLVESIQKGETPYQIISTKCFEVLAEVDTSTGSV